MGISNGNYIISTSDNLSSSLYSSSSSSSTFNWLLDSGGHATPGNTIFVKSGSYSVDSTWKISINSITVIFASGLDLQYGAGTSGAVLTAKNNIGTNMMWIVGNGVTISGLTMNGNGVNNPITNSDPNGIVLAGNNDLVKYSTIYNTCGWAFLTYGSATNSGFDHCLIYHIGANGFSDVAETGNHCFCTNSEVYGCGDVGIDVYGGWNTVITGNYVHDFNAETCTLLGYQQSYLGINVELGGGTGSNSYTLIAGNTITNCNVDAGISICSSGRTYLNYNLISGNTLTNCYHGIEIVGNKGASYNAIEYNSITNSHGEAILLDSSCTSTTVYSNTFSGCSNNLVNNGLGTITSNPVPTPSPSPTSSPTPSPSPTATPTPTDSGGGGGGWYPTPTPTATPTATPTPSPSPPEHNNLTNMFIAIILIAMVYIGTNKTKRKRHTRYK